jgi:hypothetical protein
VPKENKINFLVTRKEILNQLSFALELGGSKAGIPNIQNEMIVLLTFLSFSFVMSKRKKKICAIFKNKITKCMEQKVMKQK